MWANLEFTCMNNAHVGSYFLAQVNTSSCTSLGKKTCHGAKKCGSVRDLSSITTVTLRQTNSQRITRPIRYMYIYIYSILCQDARTGVEAFVSNFELQSTARNSVVHLNQICFGFVPNPGGSSLDSPQSRDQNVNCDTYNTSMTKVR